MTSHIFTPLVGIKPEVITFIMNFQCYKEATFNVKGGKSHLQVSLNITKLCKDKK